MAENLTSFDGKFFCSLFVLGQALKKTRLVETTLLNVHSIVSGIEPFANNPKRVSQVAVCMS